MAAPQEEYQSSEKMADIIMPSPSNKPGAVISDEEADSREVFQTGVDGVEFRTVSWQRATIVFCKINFAMSILAIPEALSTLGSVGGSIALVAFTTLNTCEFYRTRMAPLGGRMIRSKPKTNGLLPRRYWPHSW